MGIAAFKRGDGQVDIGFASHDGTYSVDFSLHTISSPQLGYDGSHTSPEALLLVTDEVSESIADYIIAKVREYQEEHLYKFAGAGISKAVFSLSPNLPPRIWAELDIVPMVFGRGLETSREGIATADEEADSMARKCLMLVRLSLSITLLTAVGTSDPQCSLAFKLASAISSR